MILDGAEHHHLAKSARVKKGETVWLFDGNGHRVLARVAVVGKDRTVLEVVERASPDDRRVKLVLAQALLPSAKMELILEKASEFGISDFVPVESARSLKTPEERYGRKAERWARIAREATKQSKGTAVPVVHDPLRLGEFLDAPGQGLKLFMSEHGGKPLRDLLLGQEKSGKPLPATVVVFIGPVGGWTEREERAFRESGYEAVSLSRRILKSETAAVAAVAMILHFWNG